MPKKPLEPAKKYLIADGRLYISVAEVSRILRGIASDLPYSSHMAIAMRETATFFDKIELQAYRRRG